MGCDGGTIPKRNEIVKSKQDNRARDKNADLSAKWQFCSLSGMKLKKPIVACQLGRLYNKDAILEHLLKLKSPSAKSSTSQTNSIPHIRSLKDVKTLSLKEKDDFNDSCQASSSSELFKAQYVCPISGLDLNGKYKFHFLFSCGCVFSDRALKEVSVENKCILCSVQYNSESDLIVLNGDEAEMGTLRHKLIARRRQQRHSGQKTETNLSSNSCDETMTHKNDNPSKRAKFRHITELKR